MWLVLHFSFQDQTNQFFPNFLWFQFKLTSQTKITIKNLLTNITVPHFILGANFAESWGSVQRKSQACSLILCIINKMKIWENSITEWFFLNRVIKVAYNIIAGKYYSFWFLYLHLLDYFYLLFIFIPNCFHLCCYLLAVRILFLLNLCLFIRV